jgi:hypothetical protein
VPERLVRVQHEQVPGLLDRVVAVLQVGRHVWLRVPRIPRLQLTNREPRAMRRATAGGL